MRGGGPQSAGAGEGRAGQGRAGSEPPPPCPVGVAPRGVRAGPTRELPASGPGLGPRADSHCPPAAHQRGGGPQGRPGVARRAQARPCAAEGALGTRSRASAPLPRAAVDAPPPGGIACSGFEDATKPNSSSTAEAQRGDAFTRSGPRAPPGASWTPATRRCPWLKTASPGGALLLRLHLPPQLRKQHGPSPARTPQGTSGGEGGTTVGFSISFSCPLDCVKAQ